ncbi:MAG: bifunctional 2-C-methyl-D-erythritol 4-phosphate cytidylyltransferase/2-C-methyl-D-erythritol 2,4-cyclodiphosphate synthase [Alphaproteobacteria bacterium]
MTLTPSSKTPSPAPAVHVLIAAAGSGTRMGGDIPKQYMHLHGQSVLRRSVQAFLPLERIASVSVIADPEHTKWYHDALSGLKIDRVIKGGDSRKSSVFNGLKRLRHVKDDDLILIHDAARPLVEKADILNLIEALEHCEAASLAVPVSDTLRREDTGSYTDRTGLWALQTPQGFRYETLLRAHEKSGAQDYTDDTGLVSALGIPVKLVQGHKRNFKITTQDDMEIAKALLNDGETRTGSGFDVHAFDPNAPGPVRLCGLDIPHEHSLSGHSDADVGLHALTDALLGALGAGDIGQHFPPSDPANKGLDSAIFLRKAVDLIADCGGRIINLDVTLICEAPKIGPHRESMRSRIAEITGLRKSRVSVKATTTERLGFTGRGEGIAAQALATIMVPYE